VTGAACAALLADLERYATDPPRALLVAAPAGAGTTESRTPTPRGLRDPASVLADFPAPSVAAWDGPAVSAGAELLLAADIRIVGPAASMAFPEVGLGELPCWGGTQRLTRSAGISLALRMLVVGDVVDAATLERHGVVERADDPIGAAQKLTAALAEGAPRAQAAAREAVQRGRDLTLADALRLESDLNLIISTTSDRDEGIAAFFEKRPPKFTGE
jgi:enoyl-CoA hydratase/carnithine racemase